MRQVSLNTVAGRISVKARYGQDPETGAWVLPLRSLLGLKVKQRRSPVLEERMNFTAVRTGSFQSAAEVAAAWGTPADDSTIHRCVREAGQQAEARTAERVEAVMKDDRPATPRKGGKNAAKVSWVLMLDGWMNRERGPDWGLKPADQAGARVEWHEIKGAVLFRIEDQTDNGSGRGMLLRKYCVVWRGDPAEFGRRVYAEAVRRGAVDAGGIFVVADGAVWIWNLVREHFPEATGVLDFYHACHHLHILSEALFSDPDQAKAWREPLIHKLRHGGEAVFLKTLEHLSEVIETLDAKAAKEARRETAYFKAHDAHIHYDGVYKAECPVGSGSIESFCSQMQTRTKNQGRFWTPAGIMNLLALDVAYRNGDVSPPSGLSPERFKQF